MKNLSINLLKLCLVWAITVFLVASCTKPSYANSVHPHGELALVGYTYTSAYSPLRAFFMRKIFIIWIFNLFILSVQSYLIRLNRMNL